jgi:hypothetical protein
MGVQVLAWSLSHASTCVVSRVVVVFRNGVASGVAVPGIRRCVSVGKAPTIMF